MKAIFTSEELITIHDAAIAGTRQIRESDISESHFNILIDGGKELNSSLVNALAAKIQSDSEAEGESPSFCVFSSWLGPLVSGKVSEKQEVCIGTFDLHVKQAVSLYDLCIFSCIEMK